MRAIIKKTLGFMAATALVVGCSADDQSARSDLFGADGTAEGYQEVTLSIGAAESNSFALQNTTTVDLVDRLKDFDRTTIYATCDGGTTSRTVAQSINDIQTRQDTRNTTNTVGTDGLQVVTYADTQTPTHDWFRFSVTKGCPKPQVHLDRLNFIYQLPMLNVTVDDAVNGEWVEFSPTGAVASVAETIQEGFVTFDAESHTWATNGATMPELTKTLAAGTKATFTLGLDHSRWATGAQSPTFNNLTDTNQNETMWRIHELQQFTNVGKENLSTIGQDADIEIVAMDNIIANGAAINVDAPANEINITFGDPINGARPLETGSDYAVSIVPAAATCSNGWDPDNDPAPPAEADFIKSYNENGGGMADDEVSLNFDNVPTSFVGAAGSAKDYCIDVTLTYTNPSPTGGEAAVHKVTVRLPFSLQAGDSDLQMQ